MKLAVPNQTDARETRVALIAATVKKLIADGHEVTVESGAGRLSRQSDDDFSDAGATITDDAHALWSGTDVLLCIAPPRLEQIDMLRSGAVVIGLLSPFENRDLIARCVEKNITTFAMEFVPRISRAQAMDVLSSQANIGGYKAVALAAARCPKLFPMLMTAAGTIAPAKVFVIGAGVAGLQAIATAKRLGAVVEAIDVRAATREQVQSLGARFVELPSASQNDKDAGGYAREQTDEQRCQQQELQNKHVIGADVVICTAAVPGKPPPLLIRADTVAQMKSGSVVVDIAASAAHGRGNCEVTKPNETSTTEHGVILIGETNLPALAPVHASQMLAANFHAFLKVILVDGKLTIDLDDEVQSGAAVTHAGNIVDDRVAVAST